MITETVVGPTPVFESVTLGGFTLRIAVQADVDDGEAQVVGNLLIESSGGTCREFEA